MISEEVISKCWKKCSELGSIYITLSEEDLESNFGCELLRIARELQILCIKEREKNGSRK